MRVDDQATTGGSGRAAATSTGAAPATPSADAVRRSALLFEVGWEVCWQLGGIYTVLRTKARTMLDKWGERYALVGPYNPTTAATEFDETPPDGVFRDIIDAAKRRGVDARHGRWLVPGRPRTILIDHRRRFGMLHEDKYFLAKDHGIETTPDDGEVNEVVSFGFCVADFLAAAAEVNASLGPGDDGALPRVDGGGGAASDRSSEHSGADGLHDARHASGQVPRGR